MVCRKCGHELPEGSLFCNVCGSSQTDIKNQNDNSNSANGSEPASGGISGETRRTEIISQEQTRKNKPYKILLPLLFVALAAFAIWAYTSKGGPAEEFIKAVDASDVVLAQEIFETKIQSEKDASRLVSEIIEKSTSAYTQFASGGTSFDAAKKTIMLMADSVSKDVAEKSALPITLSNLEIMKKSKESFASGEKFMANNDYSSSIREFEKVSKDDSNYSKAQANITKLEAEEAKRVEELRKSEEIKKNQQVEVIKTEVLVQDETLKALYPDLFSVTIRNNSGKTIKNYKVSMLAWDSNGYPLKIEVLFYSAAYEYLGVADNVNVLHGETYGDDSGWELMEGHRIIKTKAVVSEAEFYDGSTWKNPYHEYFINNYMGKPYMD
jgi:hypothetical protein